MRLSLIVYSALDKKTIDSLLKYGAYDLLNKEDDDSFCEENIEKILERAKVIKTGASSTDVALSSFSKASFTSSTAVPGISDNSQFEFKLIWNFIE